MMMYKRCNRAGCRELIKVSERYCDKHKGSNHREYNRARYRNDKEYVKFYSSKTWRDVRYQRLLKDDFMCQRCLVEQDKYVKAEMVHHVREHKDFPELRLDIDNLVSLCNACHSLVHKSKTTNKWIVVVDE